MRAAGAAIFLVARLLLMGPDGTETLSEHKAHLGSGVTGLIKEELREADLPATVHLYLTPARAAATDEDPEPPLIVAIRSELWSRPGTAREGAPPDEKNIDETIVGRGSGLVQIAVGHETGRRLVLSISTPEEEAPLPIPKPPPAGIQPIAFDVELFRTQADSRDPVASQRLRTLEGRPVSWRNSWRRPVNPPGQRPAFVEEGVTLTLKPVSLSEGWVSVEASLTASTLEPGSTSGSPVERSTKTTRMLTYGIPFELSMTAGMSEPVTEEDASEPGPAGEDGKDPEPESGRGKSPKPGEGAAKKPEPEEILFVITVLRAEIR